MTNTQDFRFENEMDAAEKLLEILPKDELTNSDFVIVCSSLDSVILTQKLADSFELSYELLFSEQILAPNNPECEIAMVSETEEIVCNDELITAFNISYDFIYGEAYRKYEEKILKNVYKFRKGKLLEDLKGKNILLVDRGAQTGARTLVCAKSLINLGVKKILYATPVMPLNILPHLSILFDNIYCVKKIANFVDVDFYYKDKVASSWQTIMSILEDSPYYLPLQK